VALYIDQIPELWQIFGSFIVPIFGSQNALGWAVYGEM